MLIVLKSNNRYLKYDNYLFNKIFIHYLSNYKKNKLYNIFLKNKKNKKNKKLKHHEWHLYTTWNNERERKSRDKNIISPPSMLHF